MSFQLNSVVLIVVFTVVKTNNVTVSDLEVKEYKKKLQPDELYNDVYNKSVNGRENLRTKIKRWEHELRAIDQTSKMPAKKIMGLYIQFWIDLLSPNSETARYAPTFMEICKKLFLKLKSYN
ncbi:unnamed protein product [Arctia plantaginis]|uniref:Uncharacterized protein n=1 Tax=Arctia plantaginis TaxID=874455 RepID=A0A8S1BER5_ARCPL|nr:unnamed protein product [Arctia plantaginis]